MGLAVRAGSGETLTLFCILLYDLTFKIEHILMLLSVKQVVPTHFAMASSRSLMAF